MTLFRGSGSPGQGTDVEFLRSDRNLSDVDNADTARQNLGLASLSDIAGLDQADGNFIVGDGTNWVAESGATARSSMGVGTVATLDQGTATGQVPTNSDIDGRGFAESVASVAALRAGSFPSSLDRIWLSGYYGVGTAGGGQLYRDSGDTTTSDNGGSVIVDSDGVRWKRPDAEVVSAYEFGARGTEDDRVKLNLALTHLNNRGGGVLQLDGIEYTVSDGLDIHSSTTLRGTGWATKITATGTGWTTAGVIVNTNEAPIENVSVENLWVECDNKDTDGTAGLKGVVFDRPTNWLMDRVKVTNSTSYGLWVESGFNESDKPFSGAMVRCYGINCEEVFELRETDSALIDHCVAEGGANGANGILVYGPNTQNVHIRGCKITGATNGISITTGANSAFIEGCDIDVTSNAGLNIGTDVGNEGNVGTVLVSNTRVKSADVCVLISRLDEFGWAGGYSSGATRALYFGTGFGGKATVEGVRIHKTGGGVSAVVQNDGSSKSVNMGSCIFTKDGTGHHFVSGIINVHDSILTSNEDTGLNLTEGATARGNTIYNGRIRVIGGSNGVVVESNKVVKTDGTSNSYGISVEGTSIGCVANGNIVWNQTASGDVDFTVAGSGGAANTVVGNTVLNGTLDITGTAHNDSANAAFTT